MCGIFGYTGFNKRELERARRSLNTLSHRGPDQWGEWYGDDIYIGHRRLSIIDLSENARQPMEDREVVIAVNGEIYNCNFLRKELEPMHEFRSLSDSEVILHGYKEWGIDKLLNKIDGMFAFCIYDKRTNRLFLVRDRFGKKPLFYTVTNNKIMFASEVKAFFEFDDNYRVFSDEGIKDWIYHRGSHSTRTIFYNINKIPPGWYFDINKSGMRKVKYYDILDHVETSNASEYSQYDSTEVVDELLAQAVQKRLMSDVPVGLQLSGGVDSSLVGYYMKKQHAGNLHTFSVGFQEARYQHYSEEEYARYAADKLGVTHHQLNITENDIVQSFERVIYLFDGMLDYPNAIPIYLLSLYAKDYVTVLLTGEGADELFGGYTKFRSMASLENTNYLSKLIPHSIINYLGKTQLKSIARDLYLKKQYSGHTMSILENLNAYVSSQTIESFWGRPVHSLFDEIPYDMISTLPFYRQLLIMDHKTYLFSLVERQDRASMGAAIESRLPFLDKDLVETTVNFNRDCLFDSSQNKKVLKKICERIYGKRFTYRPKKGFPLPLQEWLDEPMGFGNYLEKIYDNEFLLSRKIDMVHLKQYLVMNTFDNKLLNYGDSEKMWIKWFLMVFRTAQDIFRIKDIR